MDTRWIGGGLLLLGFAGLGTFALLASSGPPEAPEAPGPRPGDVPPPLSDGARALQAIAGHYQVGLVTCPIRAEGLIARVHGTPRDMLRSLGPSYLLDMDPTTDAPWDPLYDVGFAADGWVVLLATPGSTSGMVRPYQRTVVMTWPEARAGELVACTDVREVPQRVVSGRGVGEAPLRYSAAVGCGPPVQLTPDGTFRLTVDVPCTLWAESRGFRSEPLVVPDVPPLDDGAQPPLDDVVLHLKADPRFTESGLTPDGHAALTAALREEAERVRLHITALEGLQAQFSEDQKVWRQLGRWKTAQEEWTRKVEGMLWPLENPPQPP